MSRLLICNLLLAWGLTACSTPGSRAHSHGAVMQRLSPADQQLVLHGHIRPGMSQDAVYLAWGSPDSKIAGAGGKSVSETWVYRQRVTLPEPMNSYDYYGPYHGLGGDPAGRGFLPAWTLGGAGYEGSWRYQPHVRSLDSVRVAEFSGGKVGRYKSAGGRWFNATAVPTSGDPVPTVALTASHPRHRLTVLVHHHHTSVRPPHATRLAIRHGKVAVGRSLAAAGSHRPHYAGSLRPGKKDGVHAASAPGSKTSPERQGSHTAKPGHGSHRVGQAHRGTLGKPGPRAG